MLNILIVAACLVINAFFSAYEMAFVTVSKEELDELENGKRSVLKKISYFKKRPERTLSVIQIGITLVGAIAAAVGGTSAVENIEPILVVDYGLSRGLAEALAVTLIILPLTYVSVVFGELVPKTVALKHPLTILRFGTDILSHIDRFLAPLVTILEISTNFFLKVLGLNRLDNEDESMGEMVEIGHLPDYHQSYVKNLLSLKGKKVTEAMIPWGKVRHFKFEDSEEDVRSRLFNSPYSRYPVIDGDVIVGLLSRKDLPDPALQEIKPWQSVLRPIVKVSAEDRVLEALRKMQRMQTPQAIIEDKHGKFAGIITIEDILEEIVGDINDRSDYSLASRMLSNRPRIKLRDRSPGRGPEKTNS